MSLDESSRLSIMPGEVLAGTYRIERVLGEGGMGVVLLGRHIRLDKQVAIKLLRPEAVRALGVQRFIQEARIAAKLKGEHVARVFDVDEIGGTPYLVMEYLEGSTLAAELDREGPFPIERAVDCVLQAAEALAEAHALGIVHRDVKLENLFLARLPDGRERVKLLDFGVSKILGADSLTRTAALVGSPVYMAPEQLESSKDVDARADIWSLGVVLFELLTNAQPFQGDSLPQLCVAIREHEAPALSELRPDAPAQLDLAVRRCLAKNRDQRYSTIGELAADLAPLASEVARTSAESARRMARASAATMDFASSSETVDVAEAQSGSMRRPRSGSIAASVSIAKPEPARRQRWLWIGLLLLGIAGVSVAAVSLGGRTAPIENAASESVPAPNTSAAPTEAETTESPAPSASATPTAIPEDAPELVASIAAPLPTVRVAQPTARRPSARPAPRPAPASAPTPAPAPAPAPDPLSEPH
jgi:serine/threonine-protein kinase